MVWGRSLYDEQARVEPLGSGRLRSACSDDEGTVRADSQYISQRSRSAENVFEKFKVLFDKLTTDVVIRMKRKGRKSGPDEGFESSGVAEDCSKTRASFIQASRPGVSIGRAGGFVASGCSKAHNRCSWTYRQYDARSISVDQVCRFARSLTGEAMDALLEQARSIYEGEIVRQSGLSSHPFSRPKPTKLTTKLSAGLRRPTPRRTAQQHPPLNLWRSRFPCRLHHPRHL